MHKRMLMIVALCASLLQVSAAEADYSVCCRQHRLSVPRLMN